ncbi:MAG: hypothetical protein ACR2G3_08395 [Solirubrobacterales bacterium]
MSDEGHAIHYSAVERGTPVQSADGAVVGTVAQVVDNFREHILDGIVLELPGGELRFVDGPEVARTAERLVTLVIDEAEVATLPPPEKGIANYRANVKAGRLGRLFGGAWKRD